MIKRTVEVASKTHLACKNKQLCLLRQGSLVGKLPFEDLGVLVLCHQGITMSQAALNGAAEAGAVVVLCDAHYLPSAVFLPMADNTLHAKFVREQAAWARSAKNRIWRQVVAAKVGAQAGLLERLGKGNRRLNQLAKTLPKAGSLYVEGHAADVYWRALFGPGFRRSRFGKGPNPLLNYGYAILRAAVARTICGAGLHPAFGVFHRNQYNAFALADDLVEPLRPLVDDVVCQITPGGEDVALERKNRVPLLELLAKTVTVNQQPFPLMVALERYVHSVRLVGNQTRRQLEIPKL